MSLKIERLPEFEKDMKILRKKFRTLEEDLATFTATALNGYHVYNQAISGIVRISGLGIEEPEIFKARRFACKALKGKGADTGIRVIYAFIPQDQKIELIEIYFKGEQANEDRKRIHRYYDKL